MSNKLYICGKKKNLKCIIKGTENKSISEIDLASKDLDKEPLKFVISGIYHNFIVTNDNRIFTFGGNHFGQLGLGDTDDRELLTELKHSALSNQQIEEISGRACFVGIATDQSEVFLFGLNNFGQLGSGHSRNLNQPNKIDIKSLEDYGYSKLCCAGVHTIIVTRNNEIWVCGYNTYGQLGINSKNDSFKPVELTSFKEQGKIIKDVICGDYHSIFLAEDGELWSCGKNSQGQLGLNDTNPRTVPQKINFFEGYNITHVSCGENHSIVVVDNTDVYGFGTNARGQLGLRDTKTNVKKPTQIQLPTTDAIKILQCGRNFTVLVTVTDQIIVFGDNNSGQLGIENDDTTSYIKDPRILNVEGKEEKEITAVSCGEYHSMFLCSDIPSPRIPSAISLCMTQMLNYDDSQTHLFDGLVQCSDGRMLHIFTDMLKIRYPKWNSIVDKVEDDVYHVNLLSSIFMVILSYVYTDSINSVNCTMDSLVELYCRAGELDLPDTLRNQLLIHLVDNVSDELVCSIVLKLDEFNIPTPSIDPLRGHLMMYIKKKISEDEVNMLSNYELLIKNSKLMMELFNLKFDKEKLINTAILERQSEPSTIDEDFEELYNSNTGDVTIWLDKDHSECVKVHKCLLAFRAPNYMGQFQAGMQDSNVNEIDFFDEMQEENKNVGYMEVMKNILKYIYTSKLEVTNANAIYIIELWDLLGMSIKDDIYGSILSKIMANINEQNVVDILSLMVGGRSQHFPDLERSCIAAGAKYWAAIHETYSDEELMNKLSQLQYMKVNRAYLKIKKRHHAQQMYHGSDPASANK